MAGSAGDGPFKIQTDTFGRYGSLSPGEWRTFAWGVMNARYRLAWFARKYELWF